MVVVVGTKYRKSISGIEPNAPSCVSSNQWVKVISDALIKLYSNNFYIGIYIWTLFSRQ